MASKPISPPGLPDSCLAFTEHAPSPMATVEGATHMVRHVNPAFCRLMDKRAKQLVGKPFAAMMPDKDECLSLLDRVYRTGKSQSHIEQQHAKPHPIFWSYAMWPVLLGERPVGVIIHVTETARFHQQTVAMNEALMLGSVRQHELAAAAGNLNAKLRAEIAERKRAEAAQRRLTVLAASNQKLAREILRRRAVEEALQKSEQHQIQLSEQARHLSHQILHAQEEERKRISRELHDEIAQALVGINIHLAALTREAAGNPRRFKQKMARTQRLVERSVASVHRFARELRPTALDDLGLIPALHAFMQDFTKRTGVHTRLTAFAAIEQQNIAKRTVLYRVAQEAFSNVGRHAQASRVHVSIQKLPDCICMKVEDDGKSFQVEHVFQKKGRKRLGLLGMRERLEMVGGHLDIESAPGQGTTVIALIPLGKTPTLGGGGGRLLMGSART